MCGCPSRTVTSGAGCSGGEQLVEDPAAYAREPGATLLEGPEDQVRARQADDPGVNPLCLAGNSAAAMTSGMIAPTPTSVTSSSATAWSTGSR